MRQRKRVCTMRQSSRSYSQARRHAVLNFALAKPTTTGPALQWQGRLFMLESAASLRRDVYGKSKRTSDYPSWNFHLSRLVLRSNPIS